MGMAQTRAIGSDLGLGALMGLQHGRVSRTVPVCPGGRLPGARMRFGDAVRGCGSGMRNDANGSLWRHDGRLAP